MGLSSAANITQSGLATVAAETAVLTRNISENNNTSYYSQKIANVTTTASGSQVVSVTRASNQAVFQNVLSATAANATQQAISAGLDTLNQTVGDVSSDSSGSPSTSGSPAVLLSALTNALQSYSSSPSDQTAGAAVVTAAGTLAQGLNSATATVQKVRETADSGMATSVATINSLLTQFQAANKQVVSGLAAGQDVTDAQDQRDSILQELSQQIGISTTVGMGGDMSVYTDSGVTLFQGGVASDVTFAPANAYAPGTVGNSVYVDGVAITGTSAVMPIASGALAGFASLRDATTATYQAQLDNMAGALIGAFAESDQSGAGPNLPGLFTTPGAAAMPTSVTGLAGEITVNAKVDPSQGGSVNLLRDGGVSNASNINYVYNTSGAASYTARIFQLLISQQYTIHIKQHSGHALHGNMI